MSGRSKSRGQTKCRSWSFLVGVGSGGDAPTPEKIYRYEKMEEAKTPQKILAQVKKKKKMIDK
jgi:hypothetical protein